MTVLSDTVSTLRKAVDAHDEPLILRCLRKMSGLRCDLAPPELAVQLSSVLPLSFPHRDLLFASLGQHQPPQPVQADNNNPPLVSLIPEVETFLRLLVLKSAVKHRSCSEVVLQQSADALIGFVRSHDRRTMDILAANVWQTYASLKRFDDIRELVMRAHRTACLRLDQAGQATLTNLILRDLVERDLINEAAMFASKAKFPGSPLFCCVFVGKGGGRPAS